jgi:hypothetical protein
MTLPHARLVPLSILLAAACSASPLEEDPGLSGQLLRESIIEALDYWSTTAGITYVLVEEDVQPRLLIRPGTDGLAPQGGGRALVDGTYSDNRARSGLVVFEPYGGSWCDDPGACLYLHRHEIGHTLGFLDHSAQGLMASGPPELTDRELRMITALYSLPHGAVVEPDGRWSVPPDGPSGTLDDVQAAQDIIAWNMNAVGGSAYRASGVITRWELPVHVLLRDGGSIAR